MMIVLYFIRFNYKKLYMINKILILTEKKVFKYFLFGSKVRFVFENCRVVSTRCRAN